MVHAGQINVEETLQIFQEHIYCVRDGLQNPFKLDILKLPERVHEIFEMARLLPPSSRKNEEYHMCSAKFYDNLLVYADIFLRFRGIILCNAKRLQFNNNNNNNNRYHKSLGACFKFPNGISTNCIMWCIGIVAHCSPV